MAVRETLAELEQLPSELRRRMRSRAGTEDVLERLRGMDRGPFMEILAKVLGAAPDAEHLAAFAAWYPDRWAKVVEVFGGLAGFSRLNEVQQHVSVTIHDMSDAELLRALASTTAELRAQGLIVEGVAEIVETSATPPLIEQPKKETTGEDGQDKFRRAE